MQVRICMLVTAVLWVLFTVETVRAEGSATALVNVVVTYDPDRDGESEGVGQGRTVAVYKDEKLLQLGNTGPSSSVLFAVPAGTVYIIEAYVPPSHFFYEWVCSGSFFVADDRLIELHCIERFMLRMPFTLASFPVE